MFNQIRAEFYKLFHTKALYLTFALILAVFGIFSIGGQQQLYIVKELLKKIDGKIENVSYEGNILSISICFPLYNDKKLL